MLSPGLQRVLKRQYQGQTKVAARTVWLRFARIHRDVILARAPKPLSALRPTRRLIQRGEFPREYVDLNLRAWEITERQARKVWSTRDARSRAASKKDLSLYRAASKDFTILRQLALERQMIYLPKRDRIDQEALVEAYLQRKKERMPRAVAVAVLARSFGCSSRYVRQILQERNL